MMVSGEMLKLSLSHLSASKVILESFYLIVIVPITIVLQGGMERLWRKLSRTSQACGVLGTF